MKILRCLPLLLLWCACQQAVSKRKASKTYGIVRPDSMLLARPGAVVINPSSRMINKMKKSQSDASYDTVLDDDVFYMSESEHFIDSLKTFKVRRESEGVMKFKTTQGKFTPLNSTYYFSILSCLMATINPYTPI